MKRLRKWFNERERWERIGIRVWFVVYMIELAAVPIKGIVIGDWRDPLQTAKMVVVGWFLIVALWGSIYWASRVEIARKAKSPATEITRNEEPPISINP